MTVLADRVELNPPRGLAAETLGVATLAPLGLGTYLPDLRWAYRGDEIVVPSRRASALERAGNAVRVDLAHLSGAPAQRRLLTTLNKMTDVELDLPPPQRPKFIALDPEAWARAWLNRLAEGDGPWPRFESPGVRLRWSAYDVMERMSDPPTRFAISHALKALERRGLVITDAPRGSGRRTHYVEVAATGRRFC